MATRIRVVKNKKTEKNLPAKNKKPFIKTDNLCSAIFLTPSGNPPAKNPNKDWPGKENEKARLTRKKKRTRKIMAEINNSTGEWFRFNKQHHLYGSLEPKKKTGNAGS